MTNKEELTNNCQRVNSMNILHNIGECFIIFIEKLYNMLEIFSKKKFL